MVDSRVRERPLTYKLSLGSYLLYLLITNHDNCYSLLGVEVV